MSLKVDALIAFVFAFILFNAFFKNPGSGECITGVLMFVLLFGVLSVHRGSCWE